MGQGAAGPPPGCTHLPVMPMLRTSTGLGTLDQTENAVVRQYSTLLPRLSSTCKRGGGCRGVLRGVGVPLLGRGCHPCVGSRGTKPHLLPPPVIPLCIPTEHPLPGGGYKGPWGGHKGP